MTRVLEVLGRSAGGIARHVAQVVAELDGGTDLAIDIAGPGDLPIPMPKPVLPVEIPDGAFSGHGHAIRRLRTLARGYDVVHAHGLRAGTDVGIAVRGSRKIVTVHNLVRPEIAGRVKAPLYRRVESLTVALNEYVFAVSSDIARSLKRAWPPGKNKVEVLHLGVGGVPPLSRSRAEVRAELGATDRPLVVSVARLAPQKSLVTLLEAMGQLPDVVLAVVGEGPERRALEDAIARTGLSDRVHLVGFRSDVADVIAAADVFCLSSIWEGVPLAAQEAILLGVPIVATDVGGMRELIANKISGRLVPPRDPVALAGALSETLTSETESARYVVAAKRHLLKDFSTEGMLDRLRAAYAG
ncbi:MAG TPA: glycosyltransferase [Actinomycetota bacterium]|nr:glycosyltransferase [Actinomycetota bacterium]